MVITDEIDYTDSDQLQTSGGFADIRQGRYKGHTVAVKGMGVAPSDDFTKIRKVSLEEHSRSRDEPMVLFSNSVKRSSSGIRYHIPTS